MAETSSHTLFSCLLLFSSTLALASTLPGAQEVTFLGYLNDQQVFSALIQIEVQNDSPDQWQWLASNQPGSCDKDIYALAKVDSTTTQTMPSGQIRTFQLLLPVVNPHQSTTVYLCQRQGPSEAWTELRQRPILLPKVTTKEILNGDINEYDEEQFILTQSKGT